MKEICFCGKCVSGLLLGTGFYLYDSDNGYGLSTSYDLNEDEIDYYWDLIKSTIQAGFEVGQNRWITGEDAYKNVDRAVLTHAGINPRNQDIDENALAAIFAIARSSFIAGLTAEN